VAHRRSSKVFIRCRNEICDFMRVFVGPDGTVMMSFAEVGKEVVHKIFDERLGELGIEDFVAGEPIENPKISFHPSGTIKLSSKVGLTQDSVDRVTIFGDPLGNTEVTSRVVEVLVPNKLQVSEHNLTENDIVLDATSMQNNPIRCSIFRMSKASFAEIHSSKRRFVDTSKIEFANAFEVGPIVWGFVLRVSFGDLQPHSGLSFFMPGVVKWGGRNET